MLAPNNMAETSTQVTITAPAQPGSVVDATVECITPGTVDAPGQSGLVGGSTDDCGICLQAVQQRAGKALMNCGTCDRTLHLSCYFGLPAQSTCPCCRQAMDADEPIDEGAMPTADAVQHALDEYTVLIVNGARQGESIQVSIDSGTNIAILGKEVAFLLCERDSSTIYDYLDVDPGRVRLKADGIKLDCLDVLPADKRRLVQAEILEDGWQDSITAMRARGQDELASALCAAAELTVEGEPWCTTCEFGDALRLLDSL